MRFFLFVSFILVGGGGGMDLRDRKEGRERCLE